MKYFLFPFFVRICKELSYYTCITDNKAIILYRYLKFYINIAVFMFVCIQGVYECREDIWKIQKFGCEKSVGRNTFANSTIVEMTCSISWPLSVWFLLKRLYQIHHLWEISNKWSRFKVANHKWPSVCQTNAKNFLKC